MEMREELKQQVDHVVRESGAMELLEETFGEGLKRAPLAPVAARRFLIQHLHSVRDIPTSILSTALRLTHECMKRDFFQAHAIGARILFAATHEYGLHNTEQGLAKTHFELYRDAIRSFGLDERDVLSATGELQPEALELTTFYEATAQTAPVAKALGAHYALEVVADRELFLMWEGFGRYWKEYGLSGMEDPALKFFHLHIEQEPHHGNQSWEALCRYVTLVPEDRDVAVAGVREYLAVYWRWLDMFRREFFAARTPMATVATA